MNMYDKVDTGRRKISRTLLYIFIFMLVIYLFMFEWNCMD